jgi:hypothetical protein
MLEIVDVAIALGSIVIIRYTIAAILESLYPRLPRDRV